MSTNRAPSLVRAIALAIVVAAPLGCGDTSTSPSETLTTDLVFLRADPTAPPLANPTVSFYAKANEERSVSITYENADDPGSAVKFLHFVVPAGSLARRPDGTAVAARDSILITITVTDPQRLIAQFQPAGLQFSRSTPAELTLSYAHADSDVDGDGDVDEADADAERQFRLWRQAAPGGPWSAVPSALFGTTEEIEGEIYGFSSYAIAFRR